MDLLNEFKWVLLVFVALLLFWKPIANLIDRIRSGSIDWEKKRAEFNAEVLLQFRKLLRLQRRKQMEGHRNPSSMQCEERSLLHCGTFRISIFPET